MEENELIAQIEAIAKPEDMARVDALIRAGGPMSGPVQTALLKKLAELTAVTRGIVDSNKTVLLAHGVSYPLTDWLTPANYARQFEIKSVETVLNWIKRGVIPADHIKEIPELGLRLVRAVEYNPRPYTVAGTDQKGAE